MSRATMIDTHPEEDNVDNVESEANEIQEPEKAVEQPQAAAEESVEDDNEPIGIILSAEKDEILVEYALGGITNNLFVSKYQTYLPDKNVLKSKLWEILESEDGN